MMGVIGSLGFAAPAVLWALVVLPLLWLILRAVPPAPVQRRFPGVALLLGLSDEDVQAARTPWWLLLLRMAALAAIIVAFAGPVLDPDDRARGAGPLVVVSDGSWALSPGWDDRRAWVEKQLTQAGQSGRAVALVNLSAPQPPVFQPADAWARRIATLDPHPWTPTALTTPGAAADLFATSGTHDTLWLTDGLAYSGRAALYAQLAGKGRVDVISWPRATYALSAPDRTEAGVSATLYRAGAQVPTVATVAAHAIGPQGQEREVERRVFDVTGPETQIAFDLPPELRGRLTRLVVTDSPSAGSVALAGDSLRRRTVALIAGTRGEERLRLLDPLHYLREALAPHADLIGGTVMDVVQAQPDAIVLADVAFLGAAENAALSDWVESGGVLIRFAGPRMARAEALDDLMPVQLRGGGRIVGGAMSWGQPKTLAPFAENSPFAGLTVPDDVTISAQVLADPGPDLADRVVAELADGTPLVTRTTRGQGQVVLFHVTANADWSTLPLSGLFVGMLDRLAQVAGAPAARRAPSGMDWQLTRALTARGVLIPANERPPVPGDALAKAPGPDLPPGLYQADGNVVAVNLGAPLADADWPAGTTVRAPDAARALPLKGWLLAAGVLMLAADVVASLALTGRLVGRLAGRLAGGLVACALLVVAAPDARADDDAALAAQVVLAHVLTGDAQVDAVAGAGLRGLGAVLRRRTSVEPGPPRGVDLETDDLAFHPLLYWPVTETQTPPSPAAYAKLNRYLARGGMIVFDTRDGDLAGFGGGTAEAAALRVLAAPLDVPPLEPMPVDHILTRTFYLIDSAPGRFAARDLWVEASPAVERAEGMPFRTLNDGVTPVVIGGADWASAWAVDDAGRRLRPVGRGSAGERQRELAYRFGVNLVMHVLTGNYKSDQVHVPDLLQRLGE